ncbi:RNA pseudouridylate synthase [Fragilaria crotonensis]|nr:RNA pseudouridylate synthase [Fragilaria crotonensis]
MNSWTLTCFRVAMLLPSILLVREAHCWNMLSRTTRRTYHVGHSSWPKSSSVQSSMSHHQSLCMVPTDANMDLSDMSENLDVDDDDHDVSELIPGIPSEFYIVKWYQVHQHWALDEFDPEEIGRLNLLPGNVSLPVALMILDRDEFPSFSKARKVCRKGNILIHRGPLPEDCTFDLRKCVIGRVGDRVFPGDVIAKQIRMGSGTYPVMSYKQPFELPVVYEDDYFAIVNKPAGVVVYAHKQGGFGTMTVRSCLPFVLTPPKIGTYSVLRRPQPVHRLDKPTSGLLLIAKTKPAMQNLCKQFADRQVRKTYTAIVNGIPFETHEGAITSLRAAQDMDVDVDPKSEDQWQIINVSLTRRRPHVMAFSKVHTVPQGAR